MTDVNALVNGAKMLGLEMDQKNINDFTLYSVKDFSLNIRKQDCKTFLSVY